VTRAGYDEVMSREEKPVLDYACPEAAREPLWYRILLIVGFVLGAIVILWVSLD
jgi:hypothetical protein